jgi:hypothetical protein
VNQKQKLSAFIKEKWKREKLEWMSKRKHNREKHKERLATDMEQNLAERERRKHKKKEQLHKIEDINILFENFFRPKNVCKPIPDAYRKKYYTEYMPIREGGFLRGHEIMRKDNLYVSGASSN